jgi:hypothetical protein
LQFFMQAVFFTSGLPPLPMPPFLAERPATAVVGGHAVAVGQQLLHFGDVLVGQHEVGGTISAG